MAACSLLIIIRKYSDQAVIGLIAVVVTQALGYGLIFDLNFFLRNLSVMGGLLMVLSDSWVRKKFAPAGLPQLDEKDRKMYFQLAGRVLLIFLFIGFVFAGDWSLGRVIVIVIGAVACVMVAVGFKAKWSAIILVMILSIFNILVNNFWTVSRVMEGNLRTGTAANVHILAPSTPPSQGLRQVRLLSDSFHYGRSSATGKHGPRASQLRREEEGVLAAPTGRPLVVAWHCWSWAGGSACVDGLFTHVKVTTYVGSHILSCLLSKHCAILCYLCTSSCSCRSCMELYACLSSQTR